MNVSRIQITALAMISLSLPACNMHQEEEHHESHKITATCPESKSITLTQRYVCQIHAQRHVEIKALEEGYLEAINVKEGQMVQQDEVLFQVRPILYQTKYDAEKAEADVAQLELNYAEQLAKKNAISINEVKLIEVKLARAKAKAMQAKAELDFASVKAYFPGIIDRLFHQQGSLVQNDEVLTTLSDNSVMWVYYMVPEKAYLEYMMSSDEEKKSLKIELELANHSKFNQVAMQNIVEAEFNNRTGTVPFRADFPNPDRLLRHGQTGTIVISRQQNNAIVIPQRATFEVLAKRYVYVLDKDDVAHQREIKIQNELEDLFVLKDGLNIEDKIVLEGIRQVRDGEKVEFEERHPEEVAQHLKNRAE